MFLSQRRYAEKLISKAYMVDCKPLQTPLAARIVPPVNSEPFHDPTHYRTLVRSLQYLLFTWPDLAFAVNYVAQFMHILQQIFISVW